ncbi:hypothetical protein DES49_0512 [Halospina denitrificans]|uniref:Outer membrane protein assembly factor BamB n=1 Tax=Halospina denitrificans TaxID=332522 RepID=A0A4R7K0Q3_9GAMM|nr:hypothetical protein [Halospina denitrificans]TDT44410.1 hypothetical protein DES49_0512 [Halospina denitrificans]
MECKHRHAWLLALTAFVLTACVATVEPEWVATYLHKPNTGTDQITWLNDMTVDSHGNVLAAGTGINVDTSDGLDRSEDALLVTIGPEGNVLRATDLDLAGGAHRSDDKARLMALDPQDNVYMVVHQYAVIDDQGQSTSWLVSFDRNGTLRWKEQISDDSDVRGLAWHQGRIYTTGDQTLAHDASGNETLRIPHESARRASIDFADNGDIVVAGSGTVSRHAPNGDARWSYTSDRDLINNGTVLVSQSGNVVYAEGTENERGGAAVIQLDTQGNKVWSSTFAPARSSYGAAGPALLQEDFRGDLYLVASNSDGRRMAKLDSAGGTYWNKTSGEGIVQDAGLTDGGLFLVGNGYDEKRDASDGSQIAEAKLGRTVQNTQGSLALDGNRIYSGYAAVDDENRFEMHVRRFADQ